MKIYYSSSITHNSKLILAFIVFLNIFFIGNARAEKKDSIGVEKKDGKAFVLHKVDAKETLYSISKKYTAKIDDIKAANPNLGESLSIGQVIRIPFKGSLQNLPGTTPDTKIQKTGKVHKVEAKETLFGIAKKYNVSVEDIKKANPGLTDGLKTGMEIIIPSDKTPVTTTNIVVKEKVKEEDKTEVVVIPSSNQPKGEFKKVIENGNAELLESKIEAPKFQALHKTAPMGTIIQVVNETNGQKIFVRVIGRFTDGADSKTIIKISQKAMEKLEVKDKKVAVTLTYIP